MWKQANKHVLALLNDLDPYGLKPGKPDGAPQDEYELEAEPIASHLIRHGGIGLKKVDEIWLHWFEQTLTQAVGPATAAKFVVSLNALASSNVPSGDRPLTVVPRSSSPS